MDSKDQVRDIGGSAGSGSAVQGLVLGSRPCNAIYGVEMHDIVSAFVGCEENGRARKERSSRENTYPTVDIADCDLSHT